MISRLNLGQISFNLVKNALASQQLGFLATSIAMCDVSSRACAEIKMCSFDVCSLFTNVPLDETIEISLTKLYSLPDPPSLPRHVIKDLLLFATKKSHFVFDGENFETYVIRLYDF